MWFLWLACVEYGSKLPSQDIEEFEDTALSIEDFSSLGVDADCDSILGTEINTELSPHFQLWLQEYPEYGDLVRGDIDGGSFGGLINNTDCVQHIPVVFVHGNSDRAQGGLFKGWSSVLPTFAQADYRSSELYGTTYGNPTTMTADTYTHDQANIMQVRNFIEAVLAYTGAEEVNLVAHSLGVTIARRAILGGSEVDINGMMYDIGTPLTDKINTFIGIAGANQGLASCTFATTDVCNDGLGLYPGTWSNGSLIDQSNILTTLNSESHYEGSFVYSIWGEADGLLGQDTALDCLLYGANTCQIPAQDGEYNQYLNHFDIRNNTANVQLEMIQGIGNFER